MNAAWLPTHPSWSHLVRARLSGLPWTTHITRFIPVNARASKTFFNSSLVFNDHPSLVEMRNRPYPSAGWDTSLFEDAQEIVNIPEDGHYDSRPCSVLVRAVQEGNFAEANTLRAELDNMGVLIQPDAVYERIAVEEAFSKNAYEGNASTFLFWWSLVPLDTLPRSHSLRPEVLRGCTAEEAERTISVALHATRRGYSRVACRLFLARITTSSTYAFMNAFLGDLCAAEHTYLKPRFDGEQLVATHREHCSQFYHYVTEVMCHSGRASDAARILLKAHKDGMQVTSNAYHSVLSRLQNPREWDLARRVRIALPDYISTEAVPDQISTMRQLHDALVSMQISLKEAKLQPQRTLQDVIRFCYTTGNYEALATLRRAHHSSPRAPTSIAYWAMGELRHFMEAGQKDAVLAVFFKYFKPIGIPSSDVIAHVLDHYHRPRAAPDELVNRGAQDDISAESSSSRSPSRANSDPRGVAFVPVQLTSADPTLPRKLEPTRFHNIFVWNVLTRMSSRETLPRLYSEFLRVVKHSKSAGLVSSSTHLPPGVDTALFDTVHFNTFIRAFCLRRQFDQAFSILQDMRHLGFTPDIESFTPLIKASRGHPSRMQRVLTYSLSAVPDLEYGRRGMAWARGVSAKPALLVLHASALKAALDQGQMENAHWIWEQIHRTLEYRFGTNHIVDESAKRFQRMWKSYLRTNANKKNAAKGSGAVLGEE